MINIHTTALVSAVFRERFELICGQETVHGKLKTSSYYSREPELFPTVGDLVEVIKNEGGDLQIIKTLPRKSFFSRLDPDPGGHREQAIAANFDYVFIMQSLNQNFNLRRLERYLALSLKSGATPVIILTKADLVDDPEAWVEEAKQVADGINIFAVSVKIGLGLDELEKFLKPGNTYVFLGSSGVGKSSLLNTLMGEDVMTVKEIREDDAKGRHTTTHRQLFILPNGVKIIDTPGMRELGMWTNSDSTADNYSADDSFDNIFADIEALFEMCRFSDCGHQSEPGCAVKAAIDNGKLDPGRWESYQKLKREALYAENRNEAIRKKSERNQHIAVWSRKRRKNVW